MFAAPTVPKSGQGVLLQHCRVSFMTYPLHLNMMIRQTVSHDLVYPQRVSRLTYTAPKKSLGRTPRGRRKKREPGRGHYDKDRPAIIAWISRQGGVVIQATRDFTIQTVQKAADLAVQTGSRLYTDSASSYRALKGYAHDFVNHTQKEYARGDVHETRAECLFSLLKPYLRVFRGLSKTNLPGYLGFFQFLRNFYQLTAFEQAEMILYAALDPAIASKARKGDFVRCLDHFDLLQSPINLATVF